MTNRPAITLEASGLSIVGFGQPARVAITTLTDRLGTPDENKPERCHQSQTGTSQWVRWSDLSIRLTSNKFVAYIEGIHFPPGGPPWSFATGQGLAPGDSVNQLKSIYGDAVEVRTQHKQPGRSAVQTFTIADKKPSGELSGVIEGHGTSSTVTSIFAGEFC